MIQTVNFGCPAALKRK